MTMLNKLFSFCEVVPRRGVRMALPSTVLVDIR